MTGIPERSLAAVFKASTVPRAHAHRVRRTLAAELLGSAASFEEVTDILDKAWDQELYGSDDLEFCEGVDFSRLVPLNCIREREPIAVCDGFGHCGSKHHPSPLDYTLK
jgi:hypothetical protein